MIIIHRFLAGLALCLVCFSSAFAQPWQSMFGNTSTLWTREVSGPTSLDPVYTVRYFPENDTTVGPHTYQKITNTLPTKINAFLLREVLDSGKVYCLELNNTGKTPLEPCERTEFLYMDYNLKKGDTFFRWPSPYEAQGIVDSVYELNGRKHWIFGMFNMDQHLEMIEGIGFNFNLGLSFHCTYREANDNYLICYYKDGLQYFQNMWSPNSCFPDPEPTSIPKLKKAITKIYPNPAFDKLHVILNNPAVPATAYTLYNSIGQVIANGLIENNATEFTIATDQYVPGTYCLIIDNQKTLFTKQ